MQITAESIGPRWLGRHALLAGLCLAGLACVGGDSALAAGVGQNRCDLPRNTHRSIRTITFPNHRGDVSVTVDNCIITTAADATGRYRATARTVVSWEPAPSASPFTWRTFNRFGVITALEMGRGSTSGSSPRRNRIMVPNVTPCAGPVVKNAAGRATNQINVSLAGFFSCDSKEIGLPGNVTASADAVIKFTTPSHGNAARETYGSPIVAAAR